MELGIGFVVVVVRMLNEGPRAEGPSAPGAA
jgi:hypothetical protein